LKDSFPRLSLDDARLLPRARTGGALVERGRLRRDQAVALRDSAGEQPGQRPIAARKDPQDLRGIPVIGPGVGGVSPGSNPESVIDRVSAEQDRRKVMAAWV
jgi:hypothetical protein